jgi:aldehyde:ferredoxin oxidoreductase
MLCELRAFNGDPFSSESALLFMVGPLTGTSFPLNSRFFVCGVSPLTGTWGQASSGGFWGSELKLAGYDGIIVRGKAKNPVFLWMDNDSVEIRDASHIWGKDTRDTREIIKGDLGDKSIRVACIGPAGEKLSKMSAIISDDDRAAARGGLGAVMGSKNLKAIALKGEKKPRIKDEDRFEAVAKKVLKIVKESPSRETLNRYGTDGMIGGLMAFGDTPIKNFRLGKWDRDVEKISGYTMAETILERRFFCRACPIGCGRVVRIESGPYAGTHGRGPEYETCAHFGPLCLNDDLESIVRINDLCNRYGLDTVSTGVTVSFAMECYEKKLLTRKDGLELEWGDHAGMVKLVEQIGKREGIGDLLADGTKAAAEKIGGEAKRFAMHVKGLEIPAHDPRAFETWALTYATCQRGACHTTASTYYIEKGLTSPKIGLDHQLDRFDYPTKPRAVKIMQDFCEFLDTLVLCRFCLYGGITLDHIREALLSGIGWDISIPEAMTIGERMFNLKRYINNQRGITRKDDTIPERLFKPLKQGGTMGHVPKLGDNLLEYYRLRDWDGEGRVKKEKLLALEI